MFALSDQGAGDRRRLDDPANRQPGGKCSRAGREVRCNSWMDSSTITAAWVAGWAVSRSASAPVVEPWGYRIDVGLPGHVLRHILPEPDGPSVRKLCETITEPGAWLKLLAPPERVAGWLTPGWRVPRGGPAA
ncbi:hypothetical protein ACGFMO_01020 [Streptomyces niveus]|uniref:hypothetical protein n=1 Tax=Streptomyces niveus TaxID=193462 RepID=UPI003718DD62